MIFRIAYRNLRLNLRRRLFLVVIIAVALGILLVGNTLLESTQAGTKRTYRDTFTGDFSISAMAAEPFTILGSEMPLVGEYEVIPVLVGADSIRKQLEAVPAVQKSLRQVSSAAMVGIGSYQLPSAIFGVEFKEYFDFFPGIHLVKGSIPPAGEPGMLISQARLQIIETGLGRPLVLGEAIVLTVFNNSVFSIRQVPFSGVYAYPIGDAVLDRVVLSDPDTARALNGYVYGADRVVAVDSTATSLIDGNQSVDELFFGQTTAQVVSGGGLKVNEVKSTVSKANQDATIGKTLGNTWNFILYRLSDASKTEQVIGCVQSMLAIQAVQVRDWRGTAGGNASIVYIIGLLFNLGMLFVAGVAAFVVTNSLALSVYERTKEIGTMRALGANRWVITRMLSFETMVLVAGAGSIGLVAGSLVLGILNITGLPINNPFLISLFGTIKITPNLSLSLLFMHLLAVLIVGMAAMIWPLRAALAISPVRAMAQE